MQKLYVDLNTMSQAYYTWNASETSANQTALNTAAANVAADITSLLPLIAGPQSGVTPWTPPPADILSNGNIQFLDTFFTSEQTSGTLGSSLYQEAYNISSTSPSTSTCMTFVDNFFGNNASEAGLLIGSGGIIQNILAVEFNAPVSSSM